jgi:hypothetical protein
MEGSEGTGLKSSQKDPEICEGRNDTMVLKLRCPQVEVTHQSLPLSGLCFFLGQNQKKGSDPFSKRHAAEGNPPA